MKTDKCSDNIAKLQFPTLAEAEFRLLCFLAYYGELKPEDKAAIAYRMRFEVSKEVYDSCIDTLVREGFLQTRSYVKPEKRLAVLMCLYKSYYCCPLKVEKRQIICPQCRQTGIVDIFLKK